MNTLLSDWIQSQFPNSKLHRCWDLNGGISSKMLAFEITYPNGDTEKMILRQPSDWTLENVKDAAKNEHRLLLLLSKAGIKCQKAYFIDETGDVFNRPSLIVEYLEGSPDLRQKNVSSYLAQYAENLAAIHSITVSNTDLSFLPKNVGRFEGDLYKELTHLDDTFQVSRIQKAVLSRWPFQQINESVLLHGDFWPGNTLWNEGQFVATIDWEEAKLGDPLIDLAISRLDLSWVYGLDAVEAFTEHYLELNPIDTTQLPYWDLAVAMRPVTNIKAWASIYPGLGREDITKQTMIKSHQEFIERAFARIEKD